MPARSGFSLVELMIVIGIGSVAALAFATMYVRKATTAKYVAVTTNRDAVVKAVSHYANMARAIDESVDLPGNAMLKACVEGSADANGCDAGPAASPILHEISLKGPLQSSPVVAGPSVFYTAEGVLCAAAGPECAVRAESFFRAQCPGSASSCQRAEFVQLTYSVRQADGVELPTGGLLREMAGEGVAFFADDIRTSDPDPSPGAGAPCNPLYDTGGGCVGLVPTGPGQLCGCYNMIAGSMCSPFSCSSDNGTVASGCTCQ